MDSITFNLFVHSLFLLLLLLCVWWMCFWFFRFPIRRTCARATPTHSEGPSHNHHPQLRGFVQFISGRNGEGNQILCRADLEFLRRPRTLLPRQIPERISHPEFPNRTVPQVLSGILEQPPSTRHKFHFLARHPTPKIRDIRELWKYRGNGWKGIRRNGLGASQ